MKFSYYSNTKKTEAERFVLDICIPKYEYFNNVKRIRNHEFR